MGNSCMYRLCAPSSVHVPEPRGIPHQWLTASNVHGQGPTTDNGTDNQITRQVAEQMLATRREKVAGDPGQLHSCLNNCQTSCAEQLLREPGFGQGR